MRLHIDEKKFEVVGSLSEHGSSTVDIECPFCKTITTAYIWSISGSGKYCDGCDTMLYRSGTAQKMMPVMSEAQEEIIKDLHQFKVATPDAGWRPSKRSINSLIKKGLVINGIYRVDGKFKEAGLFLSDLGVKCAIALKQ